MIKKRTLIFKGGFGGVEGPVKFCFGSETRKQIIGKTNVTDKICKFSSSLAIGCFPRKSIERKVFRLTYKLSV